MKAYAAGNTPGFHFQGGATTVKPAGNSGNSGDSGSAQLSHSVDKLDKTINKTSSDVSKALDDVIKALNTNVADWAEIRIARRNTLTEDYQRNAESDYTSYKKSNKNYYRAIQSTKKEIEYQKQSKKKYLQYADKVAAQVGLSEALKKKVQKGTIDTVTCDSPWGGYTPLITYNTTSSSTLSNQCLILNNSDCWEDYVYPVIKVSPKSHGTITIKNIADNNGTLKINALKNNDFYIDCQHLKMYDTANSVLSFDDLGIDDIGDIYWPRLAYGENIFEFTGDATFEISYREPRKVGAFA